MPNVQAGESRPGTSTEHGALRPDPIRRRKLYEDIIARIEAMIHDGTYAPGDQLPSEREIMETYGVGRTSVREAMFALQKMGLISINSGERARVTEPSVDTLVGELSGAVRHFLARPLGVRQLQQARMMFEAMLARHAAQHATPEQIRKLQSLLETNKAAIGQPRIWEQTDVAFHYGLAEIPGNPVFTALHTALADWLVEQRTISVRAPGSDKAAYRAHKRIFDCVAAHDVDGAEAAMRAHLTQVERFYWQVREQEAGAAVPRAPRRNAATPRR